MWNIQIVVFNDVEELDAVGPYEVFGTARQLAPDSFDVSLVAETLEPVRCVNGLRLLPDVTFGDAAQPDVIVVPGGNGSRRQQHNSEMIQWVQRTAKHCHWVTSVCTGARILLQAGLCDDKRITSHRSAIDDLRDQQRAADVLDNVRFVRDGNLVTSEGVSAGIDMSLWLVGQTLSVPFARDVQKELAYFPAPPYAFDVG